MYTKTALTAERKEHKGYRLCSCKRLYWVQWVYCKGRCYRASALFAYQGKTMSYNPRRANSTRRNRRRDEVKSWGEPCWICDKPIDASLKHPNPWAFELDEYIPVSRWREAGYSSPEACAADPNNARLSTHRRCNEWRGNKTVAEVMAIKQRATGKPTMPSKPTTEWFV